MTVEVYTIADKKGNVPLDGEQYHEFHQADAMACVTNARVIANQYVFSHSEMVKDYTEQEDTEEDEN